jgi:hypothetical protein
MAAGVAVPEEAYAHARVARHHHVVTRHETDFDCAVHVAWGEAHGTSVHEEAVVVRLLMNRAKKERMSVCATAHKFFKPQNHSSPNVLHAAQNVMKGDGSLVPKGFEHVTEMRASEADPPPGEFREVGMVQKKSRNSLGNVFYEPVRFSNIPPPGTTQ